MTTNLLLDTNVFIDYLGERQPFFDSAMKVVAAGFFRDAALWVPAQSATDAFYVLRKFLEPSAIQEALLNIYAVIKPVTLSADDLAQAARLAWNDYKDCLVMLAAQKVKADYLITRDIKGFTQSPIPVCTPEDWLRIVAEKGLTYDTVSLPE